MILTTAAESPGLAARLGEITAPEIAEFLYHDPVSVALFDPVRERFPGYTVIAAEADRPVAALYTAPFTWAADPAVELPPGGYDAVLLAAAADGLAGRRGTVVSALLAIVRPELRGGGISAVMLDAARRNAARLGHTSLVAPVRPTRKHLEPRVPMARYAARTRADGLPEDPWLRVHARAGGRMVAVAPTSMTITAPLATWRGWTGLPFDEPGEVIAPGGLVPVRCDPVNDVGVYVEPNVWYHHSLNDRPSTILEE